MYELNFGIFIEKYDSIMSNPSTPSCVIEQTCNQPYVNNDNSNTRILASMAPVWNGESMAAMQIFPSERKQGSPKVVMSYLIWEQDWVSRDV